MALLTGTNATNVSDIIKQVHDELVNNRGWTSRRNNGTAGSNNAECWVERPAANAKNGERLVIGMRKGADVNSLNALEMRMTHLDWNTASNTGANAWVAVTGMSASQNPIASNFSTGANFLRHWIMTPVDTSATPADHQYCYCVVEIATGVYRTFGFGELIKEGTWTGGMFCAGMRIEAAAASTSVAQLYFAGADAGTTREASAGAIYCTSAAGSDKYPRLAPGLNAGFMGLHGMGAQMFGEDLIPLSPSAFSGQTMRTPAYFWMPDALNSGTANVIPLGSMPDVFHCNIRDLAAGSTLVDDTFKFLVTPCAAKSGTDNSGNLGFLIRNPNL